MPVAMHQQEKKNQQLKKKKNLLRKKHQPRKKQLEVQKVSIYLKFLILTISKGYPKHDKVAMPALSPTMKAVKN